jgi:DNA-binding beta-propeller fold protein YncE
MSRRPAVLVALACGLALLVPALAWAVGELTQKSGTAGCVSEDGTGAACQNGKALVNARGVAVSPDGKNVYVASLGSGAVAIFDRKTTATGELTQKSGTAGCISDDSTGGACQNGVALGAARDIAVSPDGKNVYVASEGSDAVAILDRDTSNGELTQKAVTAGCVSETGTGGACQDGKALVDPEEVAVSPDGKSVSPRTTPTPSRSSIGTRVVQGS